MGKIVAIGGGSLGAGETRAIDQAVIRLTGQRRPRALFIPTATTDSVEYWDIFRTTYSALGCDCEVLYLIRETPSKRRIAQLIREADLIYVGGGNTLKMMRRWRHLGVDALLEKAYRKGTVMSGLSAGCLCWFDWGHSDSMSFYDPDDWDYVRVRGLGLINALSCPHYDGEQRDKSFEAMIRRTGDLGIALDNCCAIEVVDDQYRILTSREGAGAHRVRRQRGAIISERIGQGRRRRELAGLLGQ